MGALLTRECPVKALAKRRNDVHYLGYNFGKMNFGKVDVALVHPTDGIGQNYGLKIKTTYNNVYIQLLASSLLTKVLADFLSVIYLLNLVLKTRN